MTQKVKSNDWIEKLKDHSSGAHNSAPGTALSGAPATSNGQRKLRSLPFSRQSFIKIVRNFFIHKSIARCISRADIPAISAFELEMGQTERGFGSKAIGRVISSMILSSQHKPLYLFFSVILFCL